MKLFLVFCLGLLTLTTMAGAVETAAPRAMIVETGTGSILYSKAAERPFAPANFTKLMTAAVVADALAKGEVQPETSYKVSEHAWRTGGAPARVTTMFAAVRSSVPVDALLKGLVVQYANDAAIILAEGIGGTEEAFAARMNDLARAIGMRQTRFVNPTGLNAKGARTSLSDIARLVAHVQTDRPDLFGLYRLAEFEWNKILQTNKTTFLRDIPGVSGMIMAYDETDGFGAVVTVERDGRRMLVLASGLKSPAERDAEVRALIDAAFAEFARVTLYPADVVVTTVRVFGGTETRVAVKGKTSVDVTLPNGERDEFRAKVVYDGPIRAPVTAGSTVAMLEIRVDGRLYQQVPLVAAADVPAGTMANRARDGLRELLVGWW